MGFNWRNIFSFRKSQPLQIDGPRRALSAGPVFVNEDTAMKVSAFYRGVIYVSTQISKLPWDVKDKTNKILEEDPVYKLLNLSPNSEMNALTFRLCMVQNAIIHGNSFAEIERDGIGRPIGLWPIPSRSVDLVRDPGNNKLYYRIADAARDGGDAFLDPRDMFHVRNFHTKDGLVGQGLVAYATETLGIATAADRMASGLFNNGGMPSGVLKVTGVLSDEAYKRLQESWKAQHSGRKTGGVAILEEGTSFEPLNMNPEVLQFLDSRKFGVLEIARFLGLPPTKLFDITAATYSNVENANLEVATDTLDAWACNLEMEADVKLLTNRFGGKFTELDLYAVFRGDMTTRANYFSKMMQCGAITPNQIRQREGLAPYADGDKYYIAVNNYTPADRVDEVVDAQITSKTKNLNAPQKDDEGENSDDEQKALTQAAIRFLNK